MELQECRWRVVGRSVRGTSHVRSGLPNQDALKWLPEGGGSSPLVLAVADGHGTPKSFRSQVGAAMAVGVGTKVCYDFLSRMATESPSLVKNAAERYLTAELVSQWREGVASDYRTNPFSPEEITGLERSSGVAAKEALLDGDKFYLAYGATLLVAAIAKSYAIYLQLGDGNILAVSDVNGVAEEPLEHDDSLIANETTSLCMPGAQRLFRSRFQFFGSAPPALVLVSTDGYTNSFPSDNDFFKVGTDMLNMATTESGWKTIETSLDRWLNESSVYSGDDVTLGVICRDDIVKAGSSVQKDGINNAPTATRE